MITRTIVLRATYDITRNLRDLPIDLMTDNVQVRLEFLAGGIEMACDDSTELAELVRVLHREERDRRAALGDPPSDQGDRGRPTKVANDPAS